MSDCNKTAEKKLLEAARKCEYASIEAIVKDGKVNINAKDEMGLTAVHWSCKAADISSLSILLENNANPNLLDANGLAPIHYAAQRKFSETMAALISHGADINIQTANNTADLKMPEDMLMEAKCLSGAIKSEHSLVAGRQMEPNECHTFSKLGLQLRNSSNFKKLYFFCRKILLTNIVCTNYLDVCRLLPIVAGRRAGIISDIYYYLVNVTANDVQITVPVYDATTEFDNVFIVDNSGHTFNCSPVKENKQRVCRATMTLQNTEDNMHCFAVFIETKSDTFTITGGNQTFQSSVDNRYKVKLPNGCCKTGSSITMQVYSTVEYVNSLDSKYVMTASNFCAMNLSNKNNKPFTLTLSLPLGYMKNNSHSDVVVYHAASTQQTPTEWKEVAREVNVLENCVTVNDKSITSGTCIVTEVPKKRTREYHNGLKEFLCRLFKAILSRKRPCKFYATLERQQPADEYQIYVGLVETSRYSEILRRWTMEQCVNSCTGEYLVRSNSIYSVSLNVSIGKIIGATNLNLIYHYKSKLYQEFRVKCEHNDTVTVNISECQAIDSRDFDNQLRTQIFLPIRPNVKPEQKRQFTEFPDDEYLRQLATEIGYDWVMLGIGLGLTYGSLELYQQNSKTSDAIFTMLLDWREQHNSDVDIGIATLLRTLANLGRQDLLTNVDQNIQKLLKQKPHERICKWVRTLVEADGLDSVDGSFAHSSVDADRSFDNICVSCVIEPEKAPSPLSHKFLITVVKIVGCNRALLEQLGFKEFLEVHIIIKDPTAAMFTEAISKHTQELFFIHVTQCLVKSQRQYQNLTKFIEDLLNILHMQKNNDAVIKIREECLKWLTSSEYKSDELKRNIGKVLDDIHKKILKMTC